MYRYLQKYCVSPERARPCRASNDDNTIILRKRSAAAAAAGYGFRRRERDETLLFSYTSRVPLRRDRRRRRRPGKTRRGRISRSISSICVSFRYIFRTKEPCRTLATIRAAAALFFTYFFRVGGNRTKAAGDVL